MLRRLTGFVLGSLLLVGCALWDGNRVPAPSSVTPAPTAPLYPEASMPASATSEQATAPAAQPADPSRPGMPHLDSNQPVEIRVIDMQSPTAGWAIGGPMGADDHVLSTTDGGARWSDVTPPEPSVAMPYGTRRATGAFLGTDRAWVVYDHVHPEAGVFPVVVWRTEDGGRTWMPGKALDLDGLEPDFIPRLLGFVDESTGWLLVELGAGMSHEYVALYLSEDGGTTWARVLDPYGDSPIQVCWKTGLNFADAQTGWLTRDCRGVVDGAFVDITRDGGRTWTSVELLPPADQPQALTYPNACGTHSPRLLSPAVGWVGVSCEVYEPGEVEPGPSLVYRTEDGGVSWTALEAPYGELGHLEDRLTWTFGRQIHGTLDEGTTWSLIKAVSWDGAFDFVDLEHGWAVARDGERIAFVQTSDGGKTWKLLEPKTAPEG